jgi:hypothetical protein
LAIETAGDDRDAVRQWAVRFRFGDADVGPGILGRSEIDARKG